MNRQDALQIKNCLKNYNPHLGKMHTLKEFLSL